MILNRAKDQYRSGKQRLREKAKDKYRNLSEEGKIKKRIWKKQISKYVWRKETKLKDYQKKISWGKKV